MNDFFLSIIVPNYNNEKYLTKCLDSIIEQTFKNIEIVVVDDFSTDSSKEILRKYERQYPFIKIIYNKNNIGVTKSRQVAISASTGEYITTLDSDDYYIDNEKLKKEIEIIRKFQEKGKNNIIAFSNIVLVDDQEIELFPNAKNKIQEGNVLVDLFCRSCMVPRDFIFSKKQYKEVGGYDSNIPIYEDWDLKLRLASKNEFYYTGLDGIGYRRHGKGLSSADADEHVRWLKYIYKKNIKHVELGKRSFVKNKLNNFIENNFNVSIERRLMKKIKNILGWKI